MIVANSDLAHTSKFLFWPDVIILAAIDLDLMQFVSMAIGVQRQTEMNQIMILFAGINDHLHSRGFLSRLREPTTVDGGSSMASYKRYPRIDGQIMDTLKERAFLSITPKAVFALSPALLSERKYDVIKSAPNREIKVENLRPLRSELPAISNAMRGFKDHSLHMLMFDKVLGLELSNFSRQLKLKPGINDDHRVILAMSNDLWFRGMEIKEEKERRKNSEETRAHLEGIILRAKPETKKWLHLTPRIAALGTDAFERGQAMMTKIYAYLVKEVNLAENAEDKPAEFANRRVCQITLSGRRV